MGTLENLLLNTGEDLEITDLGITIKVREPTRLERIKARNASSSVQGYKELSEADKNEEFISNLIPYMIVEPKMTYDDLNKMPESKRIALVKAMVDWWNKKLSSIKEEVSNF
jgi:hypothetical protein